MKAKKCSGIWWLLTANTLLVSAFLFNFYWSNYVHQGEDFPTELDFILRLLYVISGGIALTGLRIAIRYKKSQSNGCWQINTFFFTNPATYSINA